MSRVSEDEREALRQAAYSAAPILAKLKEQRADLDARIARFQTIVDAYEELIGKGPRRSPEAAEGAAEQPHRGQVTSHIDAVLMAGGDYKEPELRAAIGERFGIKYSRATTYTALRRGEGKKYEKKEKRWRMKPSA